MTPLPRTRYEGDIRDQDRMVQKERQGRTIQMIVALTSAAEATETARKTLGDLNNIKVFL